VHLVDLSHICANSKTQNDFLFPVLAMFRHDCPLAVKPASTPRRLVHQKKLGEILCLLIRSFLLCLSWLFAQLSSEIPEGLNELLCILHDARF